jgi:hypothetical protein
MLFLVLQFSLLTQYHQLGDHKQASPELCRLRIVCRTMNAIVEARLFSHIIIDICLNGAETTSAQLEALSSGRASRSADTLAIRSLRPLPEDDQSFISRIMNGSYEKQAAAAMARVRRDLHGAILSLKNVTTVELAIPSFLLACITYSP